MRTVTVLVLSSLVAISALAQNAPVDARASADAIKMQHIDAELTKLLQNRDVDIKRSTTITRSTHSRKSVSKDRQVSVPHRTERTAATNQFLIDQAHSF